MNPARHRSRADRLRAVPGFHSPIPFRPLSRAELLGIDHEIEQRWPGRHDGRLQSTAVMVQILELATGCGDLADECSADEVRALFDVWETVQDEHMPDIRQLGAEAELQLREGSGVLVIDATAAAHSESPADFYGEAVSRLSDGQLGYYLAVRGAHQTWSDGEKCLTMAELRRRAGRSGTTNQRGGG